MSESKTVYAQANISKVEKWSARLDKRSRPH